MSEPSPVVREAREHAEAAKLITYRRSEHIEWLEITVERLDRELADFEIPADNLDGWRSHRHTCPTCERVAAGALRGTDE